MEFQSKVFIVTGGSSGIGRATAVELIKRGAKVLVTGRDEQKLKTVAQNIGAAWLSIDVGRPDAAEKTVKAALDAFGSLHGLINNAGHGWVNAMHEYTWNDFEDVYRVNVFGAAMMGQEAAKVFMAQRYGNIVNIASTAAMKGYAKGSVYSSSKFALRGLTQCWQAELRPYNIRVIGVNPSEVTTAFAQPGRKERPEVENKLRPKEIAHAIIEALSMDDRGYIPELTIHATNPF